MHGSLTKMEEYDNFQIVYDMFVENCSMRRKKQRCKQEKPMGKKVDKTWIQEHCRLSKSGSCKGILMGKAGRKK